MSRVSSTKIPPVFLRPGFALVVLVQCIVYCYISLPKKKSIGHTLQGRYSLIPTSSASVEILYLTFAPTFFVQHYMPHGYGPSSVTYHVVVDRVSCINPCIYIFKALFSNDSFVINGFL